MQTYRRRRRITIYRERTPHELAVEKIIATNRRRNANRQFGRPPKATRSWCPQCGSTGNNIAPAAEEGEGCSLCLGTGEVIVRRRPFKPAPTPRSHKQTVNRKKISRELRRVAGAAGAAGAS